MLICSERIKAPGTLRKGESDCGPKGEKLLGLCKRRVEDPVTSAEGRGQGSVGKIGGGQ